ncbi:MAG TPA: hypothetical protein VET87_22165 [Rubrivivax sp.]|nr:hypothetical protein [Rubrivivax sp.]
MHEGAAGGGHIVVTRGAVEPLAAGFESAWHGAPAAFAHEVRPRHLELTESGPGSDGFL